MSKTLIDQLVSIPDITENKAQLLITGKYYIKIKENGKEKKIKLPKIKNLNQLKQKNIIFHLPTTTQLSLIFLSGSSLLEHELLKNVYNSFVDYLNKFNPSVQLDKYKENKLITEQDKIENDKKNYSIHKNKSISIYCVGSFRRLKSISRDIDVLVIYKNENTQKLIIPNFDKGIKDLKYYIDTYNITNIKNISPTIMQKLPKIIPLQDGQHSKRLLYKFCISKSKKPQYKYYKIDIFINYQPSFYYALIHHTGDGQFNIAMRAHAKHQGYLLNQYGLFNNTSNKNILPNPKSERDIFDYINKTWKYPWKRTIKK